MSAGLLLGLPGPERAAVHAPPEGRSVLEGIATGSGPRTARRSLEPWECQPSARKGKFRPSVW